MNVPITVVPAAKTAAAVHRIKKSFLEALAPESSVKKVIGVVSGKGGVGKSLVTSMMAVSMSRKGKHAAILDADITGPSIPMAFGVAHEKAGVSEDGKLMIPARSLEGVDIMSANLLLDHDTDPVIWRGPVIAGAVKQFWTETLWKDVDYMFVDMPPGTGDVPLTVFQSLPVDGSLSLPLPQETGRNDRSQGSKYGKEDECAYPWYCRKYELSGMS